MTADGLDAFEYSPASDHSSEAQRRHYWAVAIGLQDVDGLTVSSYLRETARAYISGSTPLDETGSLVRTHHAAGSDNDCAEADLVSVRIVELLARGAFALVPEMLTRIHAYLFQDLDCSIYHPGEFKTERMVKQEEILNGDSVLYADPLAYDLALRGAFNAELAKTYQTFDSEELKDFCHTIAFLWQIHPFYEGNTRAIAVFSELYLNYLGFCVTNEPFEQHARYFRDALVRAMYRNAAAQVFPDERFLVEFYENVLGFRQTELSREAMICTALFDNPTFLRNVNPDEAFKK